MLRKLLPILAFSSISFVPGACETPTNCWTRCITEKQDGKEPAATNCDDVCETETDPEGA